MPLNEADLVWISRLPAPEDLDTPTVKTLRRMLTGASSSEKRLIDSLLVCGDEIEAASIQRAADSGARVALQRATAPGRKAAAETTAAYSCRRLAQHIRRREEAKVLDELRKELPGGVQSQDAMAEVQRRAAVEAERRAKEFEADAYAVARRRVNGRFADFKDELAEVEARLR